MTRRSNNKPKNMLILQSGMVTLLELAATSACEERRTGTFWNIGIRIEDDVLITATGHEVLTASTPKTVAEIEACMAEKNS